MNVLDVLLWVWVTVAAASIVATIVLGRLMASGVPATDDLRRNGSPAGPSGPRERLRMVASFLRHRRVGT